MSLAALTLELWQYTALLAVEEFMPEYGEKINKLLLSDDTLAAPLRVLDDTPGPGGVSSGADVPADCARSELPAQRSSLTEQTRYCYADPSSTRSSPILAVLGINRRLRHALINWSAFWSRIPLAFPQWTYRQDLHSRLYPLRRSGCFQ